MAAALHIGDCIDVMRDMPADSVDSIVTDPPYGLTQGKKGGSGNASLNLDSPYGRSRITSGNGPGGFMGQAWDAGVPNAIMWAEALRVLKPGGHLLAFGGTRTYHRLAVAIEDAGFEIRDQIGWAFGSGFPKSMNLHKKDCRCPEGWGTALKPAWEPICVARKPLAKGRTVAANVLEHGTGALNVDGCRVETDPAVDDPRLEGAGAWETGKMAKNVYEGGYAGATVSSSPLGRWPANLIHDGSDEVVAAFSNSAVRFFYCAKASKADRSPGNNHPTVKPTDLMRYLCRLVTPPGGTVLDPFMGSGSTGKAAVAEGFGFIGIDLSDEYAAIARARIDQAEAESQKAATQPSLDLEAEA